MKVKIDIREGNTAIFATFKHLTKKVANDKFQNDTLVFETKTQALEVLTEVKQLLTNVRIATRFNKNKGILQNAKTGAQIEIIQIK